MNEPTLGALFGLVAGMGLLLVMAWLQARRPLPVARRIAPFVASTSGRRTAWSTEPVGAWATLGLILAPGRSRGRSRVNLRRPDGASVIGGAAGAASGLILATLLQRGSVTLAGALLMSGFGGLVGILLAGQHRSQQARNRRRRIVDQLPTVAELLAFAVAAGETPLAALDRVTRTLTCDLADEIAAAVSDVRAGGSVDAALRAMSDRIGSPAVARFVDGMLVALERGTPLAEILRAQAADCRADDRRRLLEIAGRKDVAMLVPVVFLILPTVVLVALFPGVQALRLVVA